MVTVQQAGVMYWHSAASHHLLPTYQAAAICAPAAAHIPCQWHHSTAAGIAATAITGAAATPPNVQQSIPTPPLAPPTSYLPPSAPTTARYHHHHRTPPAPEQQLANALEPEQPIGYGSFGVVW